LLESVHIPRGKTEMRRKSTLLLLGAVVVAALIAYKLSREPTTEQMREQQRMVLPAFAADNIRSITVENEGNRITCERTETDKDKWRITEPVELRADRWEVDGIVNKFETAKKVSTIYPTEEKPLDLSEYGLDTPRSSVTFKEFGPGGRSWTLLFGKETGVGETVFAKPKDQDVVFSINRDVAKKVEVTLNGLRAKKLAARMEPSDLTGVELAAQKWDEKPAFQVACVKTEGGWELEKPVKDMADGEKIKKLAEKINNHTLVESDFVVDDPTRAAEYGLDKPSLAITYKLKERTTTIIFGRKKDEDKVYAMNRAEPAIVTVPLSLLKDLRKAPSDLRERSLLTFEKDKVRKITVAQGDRSLVVEKQGDEWQIGGEKPVKADSSVVDDILRGLKDAEVKDFVDDAPEDLGTYGLSDKVRREVLLADEDGQTLGRVFLGEEGKEGDYLYARRPDYAPILSVEKKDYLDDLLKGRLALLDRLVLEESQFRALKVCLVRGKERFVCERENTDAQWNLLEPVKGRVDKTALNDILSDFGYMKAVGFAAEDAKDLSEFDLDKPAISVSVTYEAEEQKEAKEEKEAQKKPAKTYVRTLLVGSRSEEEPEGFFAMLEGDHRVFVLRDYKVKDLQVNLASKLVCESKDLRKLLFRTAGKSVIFSYDEEDEKWTDEKGEDLKEEVLQRLKKAVDLLRSFEAKRIEAYTQKSPALYGFDAPFLVVELTEKDTSGKKIVVGKEAAEKERFIKGPASSFVLVASEDDIQKLTDATKEPAEGPNE